MSVILTSQQEAAVGLAVVKLHERKEDCRVGGYAGTGKTTLIAETVERLTTRGFKRVFVMAPTGKAANVLTNKGVSATTIHRQLYELEDDKNCVFRLKHFVEADYFIIDEASMISVDLYNDIKSFDKPTLFIGDPAQLEPVGDDAKLMHQPDLVLTQIHRTAEASDIIRFATALRTSIVHPQVYRNTSHKHPPHPGIQNLAFRLLSSVRRSEWMAFDQIIVGKNMTRNKFNQTFKISKTALPTVGDKLICLKNDYQHGIFNGEMFTVTDDNLKEDEYSGELCIELENYEGFRQWYPFWREFFFDQSTPSYHKPRNVCWFDFAYAITCHKSQGSEWNNVAVVDEAFGTPPNRWRYTAATRAAKQLTWIK